MQYSHLYHLSTHLSTQVDAVVLPGGFAPDYMRRCVPMLAFICAMAAANKPVAAICHGPWMLCSARPKGNGHPPLVSGRRATSFVAIKDDLINAGAEWVDDEVVVDGPLITSRTPDDLTPWVHAIIKAMI